MNGHADQPLTNGNGEEKAVEDADDPPLEDLTAGAPAPAPGEELIVMQDTGFNIKIVAPGLDPFDLTVWEIFSDCEAALYC